MAVRQLDSDGVRRSERVEVVPNVTVVESPVDIRVHLESALRSLGLWSRRRPVLSVPHKGSITSTWSRPLSHRASQEAFHHLLPGSPILTCKGSQYRPIFVHLEVTPRAGTYIREISECEKKNKSGWI